jgi:hypothetical protein
MAFLPATIIPSSIIGIALGRAAFLNKVKPKVAVIQAGEGNQYGHPTPDALKGLKDASVASDTSTVLTTTLDCCAFRRLALFSTTKAIAAQRLPCRRR